VTGRRMATNPPRPARREPIPALELDLRALTQGLRRAGRGSSEAVIVTGEAGSGKSSALLQIAARARRAGIEVAHAHAGAAASVPFGVIDELFGELLPEAQRGVLWTAAGPEDADRVARAVLQLLRSRRASGSIALVVDGADSIDTESMEVLERLAAYSAKLPVLLAVSMRSGHRSAAGDLVGALHQGRSCVTVRLVPLREDEVEDAFRRAGLVDLDGEFLAACADQVAGNAGYLHDVIEELRWRAIQPVEASLPALEALVPASTVRRVESRIRHLGADAGRVADAVFILDADATPGRVARLAALDLDDLSPVLAELTAAAVLAESRQVVARCPLVRRALALAPSSSSSGDMRRAAAAMLRDEGVSPERIAFQLHAAQPGSSIAAEALSAAAEAAIDAGMFERAERHLSRLLAEPASEEMLDEGRLLLCCTQVALGRPAARMRFEELLQATSDRDEQASTLSLLGDVHTIAGQLHGGARAFRRARDLLAGDGGRLGAVLDLRIAAVGVHLPRLAAEVRQILEVRHDERGPGRVSLTKAVLGAFCGMPRGEVMELLDRDRAAGRPAGRWGPTAAWLSIGVLVWCDELKDAERACEAQLVPGTPPLQALGVLSQRALLRGITGPLEGAIADADAVEAAFETRVGGHPFATVAATAGALAEIELGRAARAASRIARLKLREEAQATDALVFEARGRIALASGRPAAALDALDAALRIADSVEMVNPAVLGAWFARALALQQVGHPEIARRTAVDALERARAFGSPRATAIALRTAAVVGGTEEALDLLEESLALLDGSGAEMERVRSLLAHGQALVRANRRAAARAPLGEALDLASRLGAELVRRRATAELRAAGARPRRDLLRGVDSLTAAERQVALRASRGQSNKQIAERLVVSRKTVEWHLQNVYAKLGISSRRQLAVALGDGAPDEAR